MIEVSNEERSVFGKTGAGDGVVAAVLISASVVSCDPILAMMLLKEVSMLLKSGFSIVGGGTVTAVLISPKVFVFVATLDLNSESAAITSSSFDVCEESTVVSGEATCSCRALREALICSTACSRAEILVIALTDVLLLESTMLARLSTLLAVFVLLSSTFTRSSLLEARIFVSMEEISEEAFSRDGWSCLARWRAT